MNDTLVTCLCVTRDRPQLVELAVDYFLEQKFFNVIGMKMLIVADKYEDLTVKTREIALSCVGVDIKTLGFKPTSLGEKRNIGVVHCDSDVVMLWDDDDYHGPYRVHDQLLTMKRSGCSVTAYNRMKFTDGNNWWLYDTMLQNYGVGGSLCFTVEFWKRHPFIARNIAEDNEFIDHAWRRREFVASQACAFEPQPGLMNSDKYMATVHSANTSRREVDKPGSNYRLIGHSSLPDRVIGAFRASNAALLGLPAEPALPATYQAGE